jgi:hypothetical protein
MPLASVHDALFGRRFTGGVPCAQPPATGIDASGITPFLRIEVFL